MLGSRSCATHKVPVSCDAERENACHAWSMRLRLLIVDDSSPFLEQARAFLEREGISVVGVAANSAEALQLAGELRPDAILVDVDLGDENGFDLVESLAAEPSGRPSVILVSTHSEASLAELVEASSAVGFVPKTRLSAQAILDALSQAGPS
jgi:DNA-binding NarL/FixJ family response regulator